MRTIQYKIYPRIGQGATKVEGTLKDLFLHLGDLWASELIPPFFILNEVLQEGVYDAGMSGAYKWTPVAITQEEYEELAEDLLTSPGQSYRMVKAPEWVQSEKDWSDWKWEYLCGMPANEAQALRQGFQTLFEAREKARSQGNKSLEMELRAKLIEEGQKESDFLNRYLGKKS